MPYTHFKGEFMRKVSLVTPMYNESAAIDAFYAEICAVADGLSDYGFEFVFVDDGSRDNTLERIRAIAESDPRVFYVSFSRNFGKEAALYAGLKYSTGDYAVTLDADLQDPPSYLPEMLKIAEEKQYDMVALKRVTRAGEPVLRSFFSRMFYKVINRLSHTKIEDGARDFRLMPRAVVDAIVQMGEYNRFSKGIYGWVGFKTYWIAYENVPRVAGETKWSFWKLFFYALDGIMAFSTAPLVFASVVGLFFCFVSIIALIVIIAKTLIWGDPVAGWPALASIIVFVGGIQLFCLGIIGQYISKIYLETKRRPLYIVKETGGKNV